MFFFCLFGSVGQYVVFVGIVGGFIFYNDFDVSFVECVDEENKGKGGFQ